MKQYFAGLFEYHKWANNTVIDFLINNNITEEIILKILSHSLISEKTWLQRIKSEKYENNFWKLLNLQECKTLAEENAELISNYINSLTDADMNNKFTYKNSKGVEYTNTITEALTHLSHHSSYHRGQVAREIRRLGYDPVNTDYIVYLRR